MTAWLDRLGRPTSGDVVAGASVGLVLLPQSMAYAELAGLPAYVGLFAAVLPPLLAALFVSSPYLQTGPTAMMALLTFGALEGRAVLGSDEYIKLAALLALIVGVTRVVLGVLRLGPVAYLMSEPVLLGFTSAAAVLILASQLPVIFDVTAEGDGVLARGWWTLTHPADWEPAALLLALLTAGAHAGRPEDPSPLPRRPRRGGARHRAHRRRRLRRQLPSASFPAGSSRCRSTSRGATPPD